MGLAEGRRQMCDERRRQKRGEVTPAHADTTTLYTCVRILDYLVLEELVVHVVYYSMYESTSHTSSRMLQTTYIHDCIVILQDRQYMMYESYVCTVESSYIEVGVGMVREK